MYCQYKISSSFALLAFVLFVGCDSTKRESKKLADIIVAGNPGDQFRNVSIRDTQDEVRAAETLTLKRDTVGQLVYSTAIGPDKKNNLTVYYTFDQYGLFEIQADLASEDTTVISAVSEDLLNRYTAKYGDPEETYTGYAWTTTSPVNSLVEVRIGTERNSEGQPFLSINFFEPLEDEI